MSAIRHLVQQSDLAGSNERIQSWSKRKEHHAQLDATVEALPTLPPAPTLAPFLGIKEDADPSAISSACPVDAAMEVVRKTLEAIPIGCTITFSVDVVFVAGAPIDRSTENYRKVEHLAEICNCSFSLPETADTITFHRG